MASPTNAQFATSGFGGSNASHDEDGYTAFDKLSSGTKSASSWISNALDKVGSLLNPKATLNTNSNVQVDSNTIIKLVGAVIAVVVVCYLLFKKGKRK